MSEQSFCVIDTAWGETGLIWTEKGIRAFQLPLLDGTSMTDRLMRRSASDQSATPPAEIAPIIPLIKTYFAGVKVDFSDFPRDLTGMSSASLEVYRHVAALKWGEMATYGDIARDMGEPGAARAVGAAMGANPIPIIIPCHRVIAASGRLGGFSAPGGNKTKARLLEMEKAKLRGADKAQLSLF